MADPVRPLIVLTGAAGQLGWELARTLAPIGSLITYDRETLDLADSSAVRHAMQASRPDVIVNAAAFTNVDRAENDAVAAQRINAEAPTMLAEEAAHLGAVLVHYSTDYVFDGQVSDRRYREDDAVAPLNVYGRSKAAGDVGVLASGAAAYVFRVGWVFGTRGRNFLRTILRLASEQDELRVVADQRGGPTWSRMIAEATAAALAQVLAARRRGGSVPAPGLYHMAPPDSTSWCEFASAIVDAGIEAGGRKTAVRPIATAEHPTPARRPLWSGLDATRLDDEFGLQLPPWRQQLAMCLATRAYVTGSQ